MHVYQGTSYLEESKNRLVIRATIPCSPTEPVPVDGTGYAPLSHSRRSKRGGPLTVRALPFACGAHSVLRPRNAEESLTRAARGHTKPGAEAIILAHTGSAHPHCCMGPLAQYLPSISRFAQARALVQTALQASHHHPCHRRPLHDRSPHTPSPRPLYTRACAHASHYTTIASPPQSRRRRRCRQQPSTAHECECLAARGRRVKDGRSPAVLQG